MVLLSLLEDDVPDSELRAQLGCGKNVDEVCLIILRRDAKSVARGTVPTTVSADPVALSMKVEAQAETVVVEASELEDDPEEIRASIRSGELVASISRPADGLQFRRSQILDADSLDDAICANVSFFDRFATPAVVFRGVHETVDGAWAEEERPLVPGAACPAPARLLASVRFEAWDM